MPAPALLRRKCAYSLRNSLANPGFYLFRQPGDATLPKLDPLREPPCYFEPRDMLEAVGYAIDGLQFLLADQFL